MSRKKRKQKYIAYIDQRYLQSLFASQMAFTVEEQREIRNQLYGAITSFLNNDSDNLVMFADKFQTNEGKLLKSVEIVPLNSLSQIHKIKHIKFKK